MAAAPARATTEGETTSAVALRHARGAASAAVLLAVAPMSRKCHATSTAEIIMTPKLDRRCFRGLRQCWDSNLGEYSKLE